MITPATSSNLNYYFTFFQLLSCIWVYSFIHSIYSFTLISIFLFTSILQHSDSFCSYLYIIFNRFYLKSCPLPTLPTTKNTDNATTPPANSGKPNPLMTENSTIPSVLLSSSSWPPLSSQSVATSSPPKLTTNSPSIPTSMTPPLILIDKRAQSLSAPSFLWLPVWHTFCWSNLLPKEWSWSWSSLPLA